jgi:adenylate kinase family enzyme
MKPVFIMMIGVPGSGKSTLAQSIMDLEYHIPDVEIDFNSFISLGTDIIIEDAAFATGRTYNEIFDELIDPATKVCEGMLGVLSYTKHPLILDQTNLSVKSRQRKLGMLYNKTAYTKIAIVCECDAETLKNRLTGREASGKVIPQSVMQRMQASFEPPTGAEGFDLIINHKVTKEL